MNSWQDRVDNYGQKVRATEIEANTVAVVQSYPQCDMCNLQGNRNLAHYDGKTVLGPWAFMCYEHFEQYGQGLGLGKGQELVLE